MKTNLKTNGSYTAKMTLESVIWIGAIVLLFILLSSTNSFGNDMNYTDEAYIDDIPFDTELVVQELSNSNLEFADEAYVDDIPFNTARIAADYNYQNAVSVNYEMDNESYIEDIPFSTEKVTESYAYSKAISVEFQPGEEEYIDDIPFDTYTVVRNNNKVNLSELFADQK